MATTLNMQLLLRRAAFADTTVLALGEPGYHTGTKEFKIGDGSTPWSQLNIANKDQIDALIKVVDDKVKALDSTFATDAEVEAALALKADLATYNAYVADRQLTDTQINAEFAKYTTTTAQQAIDAEQDRRLGVLEAKPFDTYATKTEVQGVANDLADYEEANDDRVKAIEDELDTFGDIVTHDASEFEASGAAAEAESRINETLKNYYTKSEADTEFATPAEVIEEVNKAIATVADSDTTANITALVDYVEKNAGDLTGLISEVYGTAPMTGESRIDVIEGKAAMGITSDDITAWNAEKGVKAIVDANKETWDKAATALQAADLADYAKTADVVTNAEFEEFEEANTAAIAAAKKAGEDAAAAVAERVKAIEDAPYATTGNVATAKQEAIDAAKDYADSLEHKNTTYTVAATDNALEFTVTPSEGEAQTIQLVAPTVDVGVTKVTAGTDIVVTPDAGTGEVTVAHKAYTTGTVKDATHDSATDPSFITGISIENGHVTGATVRNLAEVLSAMEFILDCGSAE